MRSATQRRAGCPPDCRRDAGATMFNDGVKIMRRASPSPGTPFSVLTGPTSGFLRRPVLHFVHTLAGNLQPCEYRCDVSGPTPSRPTLIKHGHSAEVVARRFFSGPHAPPEFPVEKNMVRVRATISKHVTPHAVARQQPTAYRPGSPPAKSLPTTAIGFANLVVDEQRRSNYEGAIPANRATAPSLLNL